MEAVRDAVVSGQGDELLVAAIYSAGRRAFAKSAARAFARSQAARGDMASAGELVRLHGQRKPGAWCTEATVALARKVCGEPEAVEVHCEGEDRALIKASIVSGHAAEATSGLSRLLRDDEVADALAHARIVGPASPEVVFDAALGAGIGNRAKAYVELLREVHRIVGPDKQARGCLIDAAVAFGSGAVRVKPPSVREAEERMRMIALYSAPRRRAAQGGRGRGRGARVTTHDVKTLDIKGLGGEGETPVEVVKC